LTAGRGFASFPPEPEPESAACNQELSAFQKEGGRVQESPVAKPLIVAVPMIQTLLWSDRNSGDVVDPRRIIHRLSAPIDPPESPLNGLVERELRVLFDKMSTSEDLPFRVKAGPRPGEEHILCCDVLVEWVRLLLRAVGADAVWCTRVERLVYKVMFDFFTNLCAGGVLRNIRRIGGPVGVGKGPSVPRIPHCNLEQDGLPETLMWLKEVARQPLMALMAGTPQEWHRWWTKNVTIINQQNLLQDGGHGLDLNVSPYEVRLEDTFAYFYNMAISVRGALLMRKKDSLLIEDFPYNQRSISRLSGSSKGLSMRLVGIHPELSTPPPLSFHSSSRVLRRSQSASRTRFEAAVGSLPAQLKKRRRHYLHGTSIATARISPKNVDPSLDENQHIRSQKCSISSHGVLEHQKRRKSNVPPSLKLSNAKRKRVPVGPAFQADVPEWKAPSCLPHLSGDDALNDIRKSSTQIWPMKGDFQEAGLETAGKGRSDFCVCLSPGSVDCVRHHIKQSRVSLSLDLGEAFNDLGFKDMGEEVACSWTLDEQTIFGALVKLNSLSENKSFLGPALKFFGSKSRQDIVSYYFNVFVLRRTAIRTRLTDGDADSDDDEYDLDLHENLYPRVFYRSKEWPSRGTLPVRCPPPVCRLRAMYFLPGQRTASLISSPWRCSAQFPSGSGEAALWLDCSAMGLPEAWEIASIWITCLQLSFPESN
ncbi:hypothetical protein Taro_014046, partial [Colocasia esculenta]|nr:hypothetical protein [Colocasia esculenta]